MKFGLVASELAHRVQLWLRIINLYKEVEMSNQAKREYLIAIVERYKASSKREKTRILDEFCAVCGYERKHAIALLNGKYLPSHVRRVGKPRKYEKEILIPHIRFLWFRMQQASAKRMKEAFRDWLPRYNQNEVTPQIKKLLLEISVSTLERFLNILRAQEIAHKGLSGTKPAKNFQGIIPLRTLDAEVDRPGHTQADTVAHCGTALLGDFANSVTITDMDSTWTEARAISGKQSKQVVKALKEIEASLPFPILSFNTDCGSEFLNHSVASFCDSYNGRRIHFTRSRPYKKNDNCFIEQKNYTHVREVFGYERIDREELIEAMNEIYVEYWLPLHNFFLPTFKLKEKLRIGARIKKIYGKPETPFARLMSSKHLSKQRKEALLRRYQELDPFVLSEGLQKKVHEFTLKLKRTRIGDTYVPTHLSAPQIAA